MNLLFNPSYMKVSAGREGQTHLTLFTACVSWELGVPSMAVSPAALTLTRLALGPNPGEGTCAWLFLPDPPASIVSASDRTSQLSAPKGSPFP